MNKKVIYLAALIIFLAILVGFYLFIFKTKPNLNEKGIILGKNNFSIVVADTFRARARGLSGRESLGENEGMLFLFSIKAKYSFWMKNMNFPLDIIWLIDKKVVGFNENVPAPAGNSILNLPTYSPPETINGALELNAGSVKKFGIKIGDTLEEK